MSMTDKQRIRVATDIRGHLRYLQRQQWRKPRQKIEQLGHQLNRLASIGRKLGHCESRGWYAAGQAVLAQVGILERDIPFHIQEVNRAVQDCKVKIPTVAEIYKDLLQVEQEFGQLRYYPSCRILAATTDSIQLEGVLLGDFEIQLIIPGLAEMRYHSVHRVVALDPHPACSNDAVTHPHVCDDQLCPGEAGSAIHTALVNGRICDFFLLVRSVLQHYNPDSPYVALGVWNGITCHECGDVTDQEDVLACTWCDHLFCYECASCCQSCEETVCLSCLDRCEACEDSVCRNCLTQCPDCERTICRVCEDEALCPCHQEERNSENDQEQIRPSNPATGRTDAA